MALSVKNILTQMALSAIYVLRSKSMINKNVSRITFWIGSLGLIFIGALHTYVQLDELSGPELAAAFAQIGDIPIGEEAWPAFDLWQGLSLLMGFFSIALGLSNLAGLAGRVEGLPARGVCIVNVIMMFAVTMVGVLFLGPIQSFGGPFGMTMFALGGLYRLGTQDKVTQHLTAASLMA